MRPALLTLLPMLAAASLVLVGGERLAKEKVEQRIPADRDRLLDFASTLDAELDRLDRIYTAHLDRISEGFTNRAGFDPATAARDVSAIVSIHHLTLSNPQEVIPLLPPGSDSPRLPEILIENRGNPLDPLNSVILPKGLLDITGSGTHGWLPAPIDTQRIYWTRPDSIRLVAFVIDQDKLHAVANEHLSSWLTEPLTPLNESGELYVIHGPSHPDLAASDTADRGPAALLMPIRTNIGDWQIQAWDRVTVTTSYNSSTITTAGAIAAILGLGGLFLWHQQRRALQLAEERVSFVNRVSHELGTPLTNVTLNLDLATEILESHPKESRRRLGIVIEEIERLGRLVANVLTFSRRERQPLQLDPQPCTPDEIITQIINSFRPALLRREIEIEWTPNAATRTLLDPDALGQIVGNLISNVEKYAAAGHWLGITSRLTGEQLTVRVTDRGPGIPSSSQDRIFEPFERVHRGVNEGASGTGLGLTIARELATCMGGSLTLIPVKQGTCFELLLPTPENLKIVPEDNSSAA